MTTGLSVLAVDDEAPALDELVYLLWNSAVASHVRAVSSATDALHHLHDEHFDVVLLDIAMPGMDGLELARVVAQFSHPPAIVFVTAHEEHALAAFDVGGSGYLLKPVTQERLVTALRRVALPRQEDHPDDDALETIPVEIGTLTKMVSRDEVSWAESSGDYVRLHLRDGAQHLVRLPMSLLEEHWRDHGFARIHRSYLVSLREITRGPDVAGPHGRRRRHLRPPREPPPFQGAQGQARAPRAAVAGLVTAEPASARQVVRSQARRPGGRASSPALDDLYEPDAYGRELLASLMRAQGGACLTVLLPALALLALYPLLTAIFPWLATAQVLGLPLTLLILGGGIYPPLVLLGYWYVRRAERLEQQFVELLKEQ